LKQPSTELFYCYLDDYAVIALSLLENMARFLW